MTVTTGILDRLAEAYAYDPLLAEQMRREPLVADPRPALAEAFKAGFQHGATDRSVERVLAVSLWERLVTMFEAGDVEDLGAAVGALVEEWQQQDPGGALQKCDHLWQTTDGGRHTACRKCGATPIAPPDSFAGIVDRVARLERLTETEMAVGNELGRRFTHIENTLARVCEMFGVRS